MRKVFLSMTVYPRNRKENRIEYIEILKLYIAKYTISNSKRNNKQNTKELICVIHRLVPINRLKKCSLIKNGQNTQVSNLKKTKYQ